MRVRVLGVVAVLISLPALVALAEGVSFHRSQRHNGRLVSSDREREYLVHVPRSYDATRPTALVISLHAAALWGAAQRDLSGWNTVADERGFVVVYPSGLMNNGPRVWRMFPSPGLQADVRFISDLIDHLSARYNLDPSRIYVDGLSNGGGMAFVLSCTMRGRIAAVGMVGAALLTPFEWCPDKRPVPMIAFHGTADTAAPYNGGPSWVSGGAFQSAPTFVAKWAGRNGCADAPEERDVAPDVSRRAYRECDEGADVVFFTIRDGGHSWPGGRPVPEWFAGRTTQSISATRELWSFFDAHRGGRDSFSGGK